MKLAYIAYDRTALKAHFVLEQHFERIDTFLVDSEKPIAQLDFADLPLMAHNTYIQHKNETQTQAHKKVLSRIQDEYSFFKNQIYANEKINHSDVKKLSPPAIARSVVKNIFPINELVGFSYNKKSYKHYFKTLKNAALLDYDYVIIQNHQLVTDALEGKEQNIFTTKGALQDVVLNINFSLKHKISSLSLDNECIYISNIELKSIFDNWYICQIGSEIINVSLLVPFKQYKDPKYFEFIQKRTARAMQLAFTSFEVGELLSHCIFATDGFSEQVIALNYKKSTALFPSFTYWSEDKINAYVNTVFFGKNLKNKILFTEKELA
jgi:hypothetical protein